MTWLVSGRALQGVGSGGIVSSVWVIASEIVPIDDRPKWSQALSLTWSSCVFRCQELLMFDLFEQECCCWPVDRRLIQRYAGS